MSLASRDEKFVARVVELQSNMPDHLVCDAHADREKLARDWLDETRDLDRWKLIERLLPIDLKKSKTLEIGSGVGTFVMAGVRQGLSVDGIEPVKELVELNNERLQQEGISADVRVGTGEHLPYPDQSYDLATSFQVLEHVDDPQQVINESLRVLRPGGYIFFIIPSYHSFWEGHYGIFWWPNLHRYKPLMSRYIRLMRRDPAYADTLNFITPQLLHEAVSKAPIKANIENLGYEVWRERLYKKMPAWGYTSRLLRVVEIARKLRLLKIVEVLGKRWEFYTPIIFVCRRDS
ncbi:MAG: class I SAM-dependent methyltransferase [Candidatus Andersenbacteria bacterium]